MDIQHIQNLLEETRRSIDLLQSNGGETARTSALENALKLSRALEHPRTAILKISYTVSLHKISELTSIDERHCIADSSHGCQSGS